MARMALTRVSTIKDGGQFYNSLTPSPSQTWTKVPLAKTSDESKYNARNLLNETGLFFDEDMIYVAVKENEPVKKAST